MTVSNLPEWVLARPECESLEAILLRNALVRSSSTPDCFLVNFRGGDAQLYRVVRLLFDARVRARKSDAVFDETSELLLYSPHAELFRADQVIRSLFFVVKGSIVLGRTKHSRVLAGGDSVETSLGFSFEQIKNASDELYYGVSGSAGKQGVLVFKIPGGSGASAKTASRVRKDRVSDDDRVPGLVKNKDKRRMFQDAMENFYRANVFLPSDVRIILEDTSNAKLASDAIDRIWRKKQLKSQLAEEFLALSPDFGSLAEHKVNLLLSHSEELLFSQGERILRQGQKTGKFLFNIMGGRVMLERRASTARPLSRSTVSSSRPVSMAGERRLKLKEDGENAVVLSAFDWVGFRGQEPVPFSALALDGPVRVLRVSLEVLHELLASDHVEDLLARMKVAN